MDVLLPDLPWMTLAGEARVPSLAPGQRATVTVALNPAANPTLGLYNGQVVVQGEGASLSVPFQVRVVSAAVGDLKVAKKAGQKPT